MILSITTTEGTTEPTEEGVAAIEMLVRKGRTLAEAVAHINGGPAIVKAPLPVQAAFVLAGRSWDGDR